MSDSAAPAVRRLDWDSEFFNYPVAAIALSPANTPHDLDRALANPIAAAAELIYISCPPAATPVRRALRRRGAFLADTKLVYERGPLSVEERTAADPEIVACRLTHPDASLVDLAIESGLYSRYAIDPGFKRDEFRRLYRKWIEESLAGRMAYRTLTLPTTPDPEASRTTLAMITLARKEAAGEIGLVAVASAARGRGLGRRILAAALRDFTAEGCSLVRVKTQRVNRAARKLYVSAGFRLTECECIYHYRPNCKT